MAQSNRTREVVAGLTHAFLNGELDLSLRPGAPRPGWEAMPEYRVAQAIRGSGGSDVDVRLALTFGSAMDRARDADRLWDPIGELFRREPESFNPAAVSARPIDVLRPVLSGVGVSQRHGPDSAAWYQIARSLQEAPLNDPVRRVIAEGVGEAPVLLRALRADARFPMLRGPKVSVMWVRMMAWPGGAAITRLETLPVAVDTQVKKVTEYLGVTNTSAFAVSAAKPTIQATWQAEADAAVGPDSLAGTAAALDPALWFFGKWGCTYCERVGRRSPINAVCSSVCTYAGIR